MTTIIITERDIIGLIIGHIITIMMATRVIMTDAAIAGIAIMTGIGVTTMMMTTTIDRQLNG